MDRISRISIDESRRRFTFNPKHPEEFQIFIDSLQKDERSSRRFSQAVVLISGSKLENNHPNH